MPRPSQAHVARAAVRLVATTLGSLLRRRRLARAGALAALLALVVGTLVNAAEIVEAELDGVSNEVTVPRGETVAFSIKVKATGPIRCTATTSNPAEATVEDAFIVADDGTVTPAGRAEPLAFWALPPSNGVCTVTWSGDPLWMTVPATVRATADAPLGEVTVRLRPILQTPPGSGSTLRDDTPTLLRFTVVEARDNVAPEVTCEDPAGDLGDNGWYVSPVRVRCTATDRGTGLENPDDAEFALTTSAEGFVATGTRTVRDNAGNETIAGPFGPFEVDLVDPGADVLVPSAGEVYLLGERVESEFDCHDTAAGSGVDSCMGTVDPGAAIPTSSVGEQTFEVRARDHAGRHRRTAQTYRVVYDFDGLFTPASAGHNAGRAGSAIPVRWSLGGVDDRSSFVGARVAEVSCDELPHRTVAASSPAAGAGTLSYDPGTHLFQWVWKTSSSWEGTCRQLQIDLNDGTTHSGNFMFR